MSNLNYVKILDNRLNVDSTLNKTYGVLKSGVNQTYKTFVSSSFDNSQISFSCQVPSDRTFVNRKVYVQVKFKLTFEGKTENDEMLIQALGMPHVNGVDVGTSYRDAPRCMSLSQCFKTIQVSINNDNISSNVASYSRILQRFARTKEDENLHLSMSPSMPDQSQSYEDLQGFSRNPLGSYSDNTTQVPRGSFTGCKILSNSPTRCEIEMTCVEPVMLSPFSSDYSGEEVSLIGIQSIDLLMTVGGRGIGILGGLASSLWSHSPDSSSVFSSIRADVMGASCMFNYITPDMAEKIPRSLTYSYMEPNLYNTTSFNSIAYNESVTFNMNSVSLKSIPNRMYIYISRRDQDMNVTSTDTYFKIDNLSVTFNNRDGILSSASETDLYQMYLRNGGNMCYEAYSRQVGSVLCVSFGTDLPLDSHQAPGLREVNTLSMTIRGTNLNQESIIPTLSVLVIQEGCLYVNDGQVSHSVGVLSHEDVEKANKGQTITFKASKNFYGSGFWDDLGKTLKDVFKHVARPIQNAVASIIPPQYKVITDTSDKILKSYGLGVPKKATKKLNKKAGSLVGGAILSSSDLYQMK